MQAVIFDHARGFLMATATRFVNQCCLRFEPPSRLQLASAWVVMGLSWFNLSSVTVERDHIAAQLADALLGFAQ